MISNVKNVTQLVSIVKVQELMIVLIPVLMVTISITDIVLKLVHTDIGLTPIPGLVMNVLIHVLIVMLPLGGVLNVKKVLGYMLLLNLLSVLVNVQPDITNLMLQESVYLVTNLVLLVMVKVLPIPTNVLLVLLTLIVMMV